MHRIVNYLLFCLLFFLINACCVNRINTISQHHEIYDCGSRKTLINSSAIKDISIQIEPSLSKLLRQLNRKYKFNEIEFVLVFEIRSNIHLEIMNASYTAFIDSIQLFSNETITRSIEKFNNSLMSAKYCLLKSEFEVGQIYGIRFTYSN